MQSEAADRRDFDRLRGPVVAAFHDGEHPPWTALATNVSRNGALLRTHGTAELGRMIVLRLRFPTGHADVFARVVRVRPSDGRTASNELAVWFDDLLPERHFRRRLAAGNPMPLPMVTRGGTRICRARAVQRGRRVTAGSPRGGAR